MRISVSTIDAYRLMLAGRIDFDSFIARIKGEGEPNYYMEVGSAFHKIMEKPEQHRINGIYACNDIIFRNIGDYIPKRNALWMTEVKTVVPFKIGSEMIDVSGVADVLYGDTVRDYKTKWKPINDVSSYVDSYQWRFYLLMFYATEFNYDIFQVKSIKDEIVIIDYVNHTIHRYPQLESDCNEILYDLVEFIKLHKLEEWMVSHEELLLTRH